MTSWMQSAKGMAFLAAPNPDVGAHWKQANDLIVLGQKNSCVQLGCCYFAD